MADDNAKELQKREERLFSKKRNLDMLNQELAWNFYPERADFTIERPLGSEFAIDLFDSAPVLNRRDLGNARASMLRPRGQEWFKIGIANKAVAERPAVARHLDFMNNRIRTLIYNARCGFVRAQKEADHDLVTFGNAVQTVESTMRRDGKRRLLCRNWHLRDCAWLDDEDGLTQDFVARRFRASARHIKAQFKDAKLDDAIVSALQDDPDKEFQLCHVMMLADEYEYYTKPATSAPYASIYYDSDHKCLLRERPSQRFRYVVQRWQTIAGCQYALSPAAITSLSDARGLQTLARVFTEAGEKALDPPLKATKNAIKSEINTGAGMVTWVDQEYDERLGPAIEPLLPHDINPQAGVELLARTTQQLKDSWYLTKLTLPQHAKTAYETSQLVEEFIRANIPLFEPWEADTELVLEEITNVLIDNLDLGRMADWPREFSGEDLQYTFSNPLQEAIERNRVNQATTIFGLIAAASKVVPEGPGARRIDVDQMTEDAARGTGAPAEWLKSEEQVAMEDEARQQAAINQKQQGDILTAINGAGQAADVINSGLDAASKLQTLRNPQPAVDQSFAYGPT
jgi:hypothetical protein